MKYSRYTALFLLVVICLMSGCGGDSGSFPTTATTSFPVVVVTDIHFNPYYDDMLFTWLVEENDVSKWPAIFQSSTITNPSARGTDTNYPLLVLALSSIRQSLGNSPFVIFTGDILGHNFAKNYFTNSKIANPTPADVAAMQRFADKTVAFVLSQVRSAVGAIPVMFAIGNDDSYYDLGPDSVFLANNADSFHQYFVRDAVSAQRFNDTFLTGGYYSAEPPGTNLMVIGLNTVLFAPMKTTPDPTLPPGTAGVELDWLRSRLESAKADGKKVWLLMHVPPGAILAANSVKKSTYGNFSSPQMMWLSSNQDTFRNIVRDYYEQGIITWTLAAHTHMDEYRMLSSSAVLEITPSVSPVMGNNPAYKLFSFASFASKPGDYTTLNYDLDTSPGHFTFSYTFSSLYLLQGYLDTSLAHLYPTLFTSSRQQTHYRANYYSGYNSPTFTVYSSGKAYIPITYGNWPFFGCGVGNMDAAAFSTCVNNPDLGLVQQ